MALTPKFLYSPSPNDFCPFVLVLLVLLVLLAALGRNEAVSYAAGEAAAMEIGVASIDTSGFKPHQLANAGLVICSLSDGEEEIVAVNMVTQVRRLFHS